MADKGGPSSHLLQHHYTSLDDMDTDDVQRFIITQHLEKPLTFAKTDKAFVKYASCGAWTLALLSYGITCLAPVSLFCPRRVTQHFELKMDQDTLTFDSAVNDCCLHVARSTRNVPLDKVQDVQLEEGCCQTMFGLKTLKIQTAGMNGPSGAPEIVARFLQNPEQAREAIQLAVKLSRAATMVAPATMAMTQSEPVTHAAAAAVAGDGAAATPAVVRKDGMRERLERLSELRDLGVLSAREADQVRAKVLAAAKDQTRSLFEAHELLSEGLITDKDFKAIKEELLALIQARM